MINRTKKRCLHRFKHAPFFDAHLLALIVPFSKNCQSFQLTDKALSVKTILTPFLILAEILPKNVLTRLIIAAVNKKPKDGYCIISAID